MKKRILFPAVFIGLVTALFILGCNNVLLNKEQDQKFSISFVTPTITQAASSASRSATGADWKITAWLELENGSRLQTKELTAKADQPASIAFDQVVVGTSLRVKVELDAINDATVKFSGASNVIQVSEEGTVVQLSVERIKVPAPAPSITQQPEGKTQTDVGDDGGDSFSHILNIVVDSPSTDGQLQYQWYSNDSPSTTGSTPLTDDDADPENIKVTVFKGKTKYFYCVVTNDIVDNQYVTPTSVTSNIVKVAYLPKTLTRIEAKYNGSPMMVDSLDYSNFSVIETYSDNTTNELSSIESQYAVTIPEKSIGYVPVTIKNRQSEDIQDQITVPIKYELDANYLTITGDASVEQNEELKLTAEYKVDGKDSYNLYTSASSSGSYKIIENVNISWQGATKQPNSWEALAETSNAGTGKTATVTLTPKDEWCVTTSGITASHEYEVTAVTQTYNIGDEYRDDSGALIGYVFEVNDSYIKIVETNEGWQYYWCGTSTNINNWSNLINISDGEEMYNAVKNQSTGDNSIFTYANNKNTSGESGWYIPTKEELFDIFKMNETYDVLNISGAYWSSSLESITGGYTAYYVQGTGESDSDLGTNYIDEASNSVVAVKKIELWV